MTEVTFRERLREFFYYPKLSHEEDRVTDPGKFAGFLDGPADSRPASLYIHVPFCDYLCHFCPFYKQLNQATDEATKEALFQAMAQEIRRYADSPLLAGKRLSWIEIGGGTPTSVDVKWLELLIDAAASSFDLCDCAFISVEGEAITLGDFAKLGALKQLGVNRVSFGIQTFKESLRHKLGIKPTIADVHAAVETIHRVGIPEYSVDLLYSLPDHGLSELAADLDAVYRLAPDYIDVYSLQLWENTWFKRAVEEPGRFSHGPDSALNLAMYEMLLQTMRANGYPEVHSYSFATDRPHTYVDMIKDHVRHGYDSIGVGPSARGNVGRHQYVNVASLTDYVQRVRQGLLPYEVGMACSEREMAHRLMASFPILLLEIDAADIPRPDLFGQRIDALVSSGFLTRHGQRVRMTDKGFAWAGNVSHMFFSEQQKTKMAKTFMFSLREKINPYNQDSTGISRRRQQAA